jgi:hypothetical protein
MKTDALTNPVIKAAIEALRNGDRKTWSALFESDAELYDMGALVASRILLAMRSITSGSLETLCCPRRGRSTFRENF